MTVIPNEHLVAANLVLDKMITDARSGVEPTADNLWDYTTGVVPDEQSRGLVLIVALQRLASLPTDGTVIIKRDDDLI